MTAGEGWKWMGENPSESVEIDVSHDAAVNSMTIDNPSNCVALVSNLRLQDEDCSTAVYPHICTISYNAVSGLGASIGKILISYFSNTEETRFEDSRYSSKYFWLEWQSYECMNTMHK